MAVKPLTRKKRRRKRARDVACIMLYDTDSIFDVQTDRGNRFVAPVVGALPAGLVAAERAVASFRAFLAERGLDAWAIFHCANLDMYDVESNLNELGEKAQWQSLAAAAAGGEGLNAFTHGKWGAKRWDDGALLLENHRIALARWYWIEPDNVNLRVFWLCAAESNDHFLRLREELLQYRRKSGAKVWQVIHGGYDEPERVARGGNVPELFLPETIQQRIDADIVRFFSPEVARLYQSLGVAYRRGVLLYGSPGNGKTSLIRRIGCALPNVPGFILRASAGFDSDDLQAVITRWTQQAPAILVIEDLDWLLKELNVSTFLNILDGIDTTGDGLLLIATTNHPDRLDPAVNNRPGRFDVSIELPNPDAAMREKFLQSKLGSMMTQTISKVANDTEGLSFAHLGEILRLSGLLAIHADRDARAEEDLLRAVEMVRESHDAAQRGFPVKLEMPFGLAPKRKV
jgi:ATPase family associated with various cellular activities (AAA)